MTSAAWPSAIVAALDADDRDQRSDEPQPADEEIRSGGAKRIATIVIVLFAAISFRQVGYWKNSETLFRHTLRVTPPNALARSFISAAASNCVNTID
jgi:hypothetical protein